MHCGNQPVKLSKYKQTHEWIWMTKTYRLVIKHGYWKSYVLAGQCSANYGKWLIFQFSMITKRYLEVIQIPPPPISTYFNVFPMKWNGSATAVVVQCLKRILDGHQRTNLGAVNRVPNGFTVVAHGMPFHKVCGMRWGWLLHFESFWSYIWWIPNMMTMVLTFDNDTVILEYWSQLMLRDYCYQRCVWFEWIHMVQYLGVNVCCAMLCSMFHHKDAVELLG